MLSIAGIGPARQVPRLDDADHVRRVRRLATKCVKLPVVASCRVLDGPIRFGIQAPQSRTVDVPNLIQTRWIAIQRVALVDEDLAGNTRSTQTRSCASKTFKNPCREALGRTRTARPRGLRAW